jgi:hypothetical protein
MICYNVYKQKMLLLQQVVRGEKNSRLETEVLMADEDFYSAI